VRGGREREREIGEQGTGEGSLQNDRQIWKVSELTERLRDKVFLVTGGGSGIGRRCALAFAREGAKVTVADIDVEGGIKTAGMIAEAGKEGLFIRANVHIESDVEMLVSTIVETYGRLDCAFNNAGIPGPVRLTGDYTEEEWDRTISTNLKGVWVCMKYEIREMVKAGRGAIVNASSAAGLRAFPYHCAYTASKHGIIGVTKTAALEYARNGIRINAVCPGFIEVGLTEKSIAVDPGFEARYKKRVPMGRFGKGEEVADAVLWLWSDEASFITGHALVIDGGQGA
jgi:NAD(P)-dependent dehydrogenase (short-subunit alcohol dehydrogenase family)